jgi:hypothetical protein
MAVMLPGAGDEGQRGAEELSGELLQTNGSGGWSLSGRHRERICNRIHGGAL